MILLLGSSGYIGAAFQLYFKANDIEFTTCSVRYPLNVSIFRNTLIRNKVTHVINCTGFVGQPNVDSCELDRDQTLLANSILPKTLSNVCAEHGVKFIHVSSGCIYSDHRCDLGLAPQKEFTEDDIPNFCFDQSRYSWYSATKALGEDLLCKNGDLIVRVRIPFNEEVNPRNYISKILQYPVLLNATNSFSHLDEFVAATFELRNNWGTFNLTQPGYLTTKQVVEMLQKHGLAKDKMFFKGIKDFELTVKTPRSNCVLSSSKAILSDIKLTCLEDSLENAISVYKFNLNAK